MTGNKSCKQCSDSSCSKEITRTDFVITEDSPIRFTAKVGKKLFFKTFNASLGRLLQTSTGSSEQYCSSKLKGLEEGKDYRVSNSSSFKSNELECTAEFEFFRSFRDKQVVFDLEPSLYSGNNVIIGEDNNPVYVKSGLYDVKEYQR